MYIDSRLRHLLWNHRGYILTHPPKSAGTSLRESLLHHSGYFGLNEVLVPNIESNTQAQAKYEAILARLQTAVEMNCPWIMSIGHQSFANGWHLDLPNSANILINYRPTSERLLSWIRYYSKIIDWVEDTSFEVHQDGSLRYVNPYRTYPGRYGEQWREGNEFVGNTKDIKAFLSQIQLKLVAPLARSRLRTNLPEVLTEMLGQGAFNYRDLFPDTFTKSDAFQGQTTVIPIHKIGLFVRSEFGEQIQILNESKEIDIQMVTDQEEHAVRKIVERFARPDQFTESLLLSKAWDG